MIKDALDLYAVEKNREFAHDRSQTVGASEIGACERKTYWSKNEGDKVHGAARDAGYVDGYGARMRGTIFENEFWYPAMKLKYGAHLHYAGPDQQTFVSGFLSATPDGLVSHQDHDVLKHLGVANIETDCITVECKTADPRTNLDEAKPLNIFQTQVQLGLVRELTGFRPVYSNLSYTNASFWNEVTEFAIKFDPVVFATAKDRAQRIMTATNAGDLKPEGWIAGGRECEYCPFTVACGITRRSVPKNDVAPDKQFAAEMADAARAIKSTEGAISLHEARLREQQQMVRDRLREKGVRKVPGIVSWSSVKGRKTYDNKGIQAWAVEHGLDVESYAHVGEETDRLVVSEPKELA